MRGRHPRGEGERPSRTFQGRDRLLEGHNCRVAVAGVGVARLLPAQNAVCLLDVLMWKRSGEVDGGRDRVKTPVQAPFRTFLGASWTAFACVYGSGFETYQMLLAVLSLVCVASIPRALY